MTINQKKQSLDKLKIDLVSYQKLVYNTLVILVAIKLALYIDIGILYVLKHLALTGIAVVVSREVEILYYFHYYEKSREESLKIIETTRPEIVALLIVLIFNYNVPPEGVIIAVSLSILLSRIAFGGFSYNIFNTAALGVVILNESYRMSIETFALDDIIDKVLGIFFVESFAHKPIPVANLAISIPDVSSVDLTSVAILVIAIIFFMSLVINKVGRILLPIATVFFISVLVALVGGRYIPILIEVIGRYTIIGILFFTLDFPTTPRFKNSTIVTALIIAIVTVYIKFFTDNGYGVFYGILIANMCTPILDAKFAKYKDNASSISIVVVISFIISVLISYLIKVNV